MERQERIRDWPEGLKRLISEDEKTQQKLVRAMDLPLCAPCFEADHIATAIALIGEMPVCRECASVIPAYARVLPHDSRASIRLHERTEIRRDRVRLRVPGAVI